MVAICVGSVAECSRRSSGGLQRTPEPWTRIRRDNEHRCIVCSTSRDRTDASAKSHAYCVSSSATRLVRYQKANLLTLIWSGVGTSCPPGEVPPGSPGNVPWHAVVRSMSSAHMPHWSLATCNFPSGAANLVVSLVVIPVPSSRLHPWKPHNSASSRATPCHPSDVMAAKPWSTFERTNT